MYENLSSSDMNEMVQQLFEEKGIEFLSDLLVSLEKVLEREFANYEHDRWKMPIQVPIWDPSDDVYNSETEYEKSLRIKYSGYSEAEAKIQKIFHSKVEKLDYEEIIGLNQEKYLHRNLSEVLKLIKYQVNLLVGKYKVGLASDDKLMFQIPENKTSKVKDIIDEIFMSYRRESVFGVIDYYLDLAIEEWHDEEVAEYMMRPR